MPFPDRVGKKVKPGSVANLTGRIDRKVKRATQILEEKQHSGEVRNANSGAPAERLSAHVPG